MWRGVSSSARLPTHSTPALPTGRLRQPTARPTTLLASRWQRSSRGLRTRRCGAAAVGQLSSNGATPSGVQGSIPVPFGAQLIRSDGRGSLWMTSQGAGGSVLRLPPGADDFNDEIFLDNAFGLLCWRNEVFVTTKTSPGHLFHRLSPTEWRSITIGNEPIGITTDGTYIWTANYASGSVSRVGLPNLTPVATISTGFAQPVALYLTVRMSG
jgi:hypothetical protein